MAAFLSKFLPKALLFPQIAILVPTPRFTIFEAGWENGLLRREVQKMKRSLRFFLPLFPSPSTSERARRRLNDLAGRGGSNENLWSELTENVKEKVSLVESLSEQM